MEASDAKKRAGSPMAAGVLPGFFFTEFIKNNISIVPVHSRHHRAPPHFRLGVFFFLYSLPSNFYRIPMRVTFDVQLFFFCFFFGNSGPILRNFSALIVTDPDGTKTPGPRGYEGVG